MTEPHPQPQPAIDYIWVNCQVCGKMTQAVGKAVQQPPAALAELKGKVQAAIDDPFIKNTPQFVAFSIVMAWIDEIGDKS